MLKMSLKKVALASLVAGLGCIALAPSVYAGGMDPAAHHAKMAAKVAQHLAELKAKLNIDASQEAAWSTFAAGMTPGAHPHRTPEQRAALKAEMDKLSTPDRIDRMRTLRAERQAAMNANMDKHAAATKAFYAALRPEQKSTFDAAHKQMMERMAHKMHGMRAA